MSDVKFNYDRLRTNKALDNFRNSNNNSIKNSRGIQSHFAIEEIIYISNI